MARDMDVAIIGAGISGISLAMHLVRKCPRARFSMFEARERIGGTWDLFRYPGVRSDSDMYTLGFALKPWTRGEAIAQGHVIREYLEETIREFGIDRHLRTGMLVERAEWTSDNARWTLHFANGETVTARWLFLGTGYYDYEQPYDAGFAGREDFGGRLIHPQFWPQDFDPAGKRIAVIGSGATAATLVPALAQAGAQVTMIQRRPSWYLPLPTRDLMAQALKAILPARLAARALTWRNVRLSDHLFRQARTKPDKIAGWLTGQAKAALGPTWRAEDFTPPYGPWVERLCIVPDGDFYTAVREGTADVITDTVANFEHAGVRTGNGQLIAADAVVTATGLALRLGGGIAVSVDGEAVDFSQRWFYKGCMFSGVPNLLATFGYLNASWTLRADMNSAWFCRVLHHMAANGCEVAVPVLPDPPPEEEEIFDFTSGYLQRARHLMAKSGRERCWHLGQDYLRDRKWLERDPIDDGVLHFSRSRALNAA